ncbi:alpha/beta hydrolase [Arthrobacter sp. MSA 4-2]|uniref:alpha/beta fold hydrolase n=1 Tax=Arthrobacter sp. MSA 4-2 TaxID=2794349 RepID=UPI0018E8D38A|nr:alpha/beta hydrolase [Arthrobacter sp. MSA 4-2]MBJ2122629.1 alpha/beta hydrolase [Arthrobacter sp. MSA 4-2]
MSETTASSAKHAGGRASLAAGDGQSRAHLIPYRPADAAASPPVAPEMQSVPVVVLIHGIGMSHRYFQRLGDQLSAHGRVVLLDLSGSGSTKTPTAGMTNAAKAESVGALLDEIGVASCVVIGHSMGVQSATELALRHPDLVSRLVLIGAAVGARRRTIANQTSTLAANNFLERPLLNFIQFTDVLRCGPRWNSAEREVAMAHPLEQRLPVLKQPVLVLRGSRDLVAGSTWSRALAETARNGELAEIGGANHSVHHSASEAVTARILTFLTGTAHHLEERRTA